MKYTLRLTIALTAAAVYGKAQQSDTLRLFYAINQKTTPAHHARLDSALAAHAGQALSIDIIGYADFLGSSDYNQRLSKTRASLVQQYIKAKGQARVTLKRSEGRGEAASHDSGSPEGEARQRRVDVALGFTAASVARIKKDSTLTQASNPAGPDKKKETPQPAKPITELAVGESVALPGINFEPGRHILMKASYPTLEILLKTLKDHPTMIVEIQGHVCCTGSEADGMDLDTWEPNLSENRAHIVYDYLVVNGIDSRRLTYKGYAHRKPLRWPEDSEEAQQANRRVEIKVLQK